MPLRGHADWTEVELGGHQADVLREVVRQHIQTGEPVGSASVGRSAKLALSPASIRNVMAELETLGLLSQPHTSAERFPRRGKSPWDAYGSTTCTAPRCSSWGRIASAGPTTTMAARSA